MPSGRYAKKWMIGCNRLSSRRSPSPLILGARLRAAVGGASIRVPLTAAGGLYALTAFFRSGVSIHGGVDAGSTGLSSARGSRGCRPPGDGMTSRRSWCRASQAAADRCVAYGTRASTCPAVSDVRALCESEPGPGVLAYVDGEVAGWCSVAPKSTYRALVNSRTIPHLQDEGAWSVVCFVVRPGFRRRGLPPAAGWCGRAAHGWARGCWRVTRSTLGVSGSTRPRLCGRRPALRGTRFPPRPPTSGRRGGQPRWLIRRQLP